MKHSIILWVQSPEANNQSILSSNGKLIPLDSEEFQQRFNEVVVHDKYKRLVSTDDSSVFQAKTKNELISYIVYSNYKEEDVVGRKIGYMARVDMPQSAGLQHVAEYVKEAIERESALYNYTIEQQPYVLLEEYLKKKRRKNIFLVVFSLIILAALLYILTL
ncbi:MAG: hypothetical protein ACOCN9_04015 [Prevotella sp.]